MMRKAGTHDSSPQTRNDLGGNPKTISSQDLAHGMILCQPVSLLLRPAQCRVGFGTEGVRYFFCFRSSLLM